MDKIHYGMIDTILRFYENVPGAAEMPIKPFGEEYSEDMCFRRMGRAFSNACEPGAHATASRFAISGADAYNLIGSIEAALQHGDTDTALRIVGLLKRSAHAFVACWALLDTAPEQMQFTSSQTLFQGIKEYMESIGASETPEYRNIYQDVCEYAADER